MARQQSYETIVGSINKNAAAEIDKEDTCAAQHNVRAQNRTHLTAQGPHGPKRAEEIDWTSAGAGRRNSFLETSGLE